MGATVFNCNTYTICCFFAAKLREDLSNIIFYSPHHTNNSQILILYILLHLNIQYTVPVKV